MDRLTLETLARLVDETPTADEQARLDADPVAARELEALRAQTEALAALPSVLPAGAWAGVEAKLLESGLLSRSSAMGEHGRRERGTGWAGPLSRRKWYQAAAAALVFVGGAGAGWTAAARNPGAGGGVPATTAVRAEPRPPRSLEDARAAVLAAEQDWMRAHATYWQFVEADRPGAVASDPAARLAALEALVAAGRAAVEESPSDAYFNGFLLTTLAQRRQALRQMGRAGGWY